MRTRIIGLIKSEAGLYIIAGVLTTAVDYIVFAVVNELLKGHLGVTHSSFIATIAAWVLAVAFAYISNKLMVFKNFNFQPGYLIKEVSSFVAARLMSGLIVLVFMWLAVSVFAWNEYLSKILSSVFNMVFNYVASKLFIFKK